jgi:hypothetical protein
MQALLGSNAEEAGVVCQYVSTRNGTKLREARLWVPTTTNRNASRALVLVVGNNVRFIINAFDYITNRRPARGVARRENFP